MQQRRLYCSCFVSLLILSFDCSVSAAENIARGAKTQTHARIPWTAVVRGGAEFDHQSSENINSALQTNVTVEKYVASVEEKDAQHRTSRVNDNLIGVQPVEPKKREELSTADSCDGSDDYERVPQETSSAASGDTSEPSQEDGDFGPPPTTTSESPAVESQSQSDPNSGVGVKSHNHKKSNAVGDPDDDSDDDLEDDSSEEWEDFDDEDVDEMGMIVDTQLQVVEVVGDGPLDGEEDHEDAQPASAAKASGSGGVARMGHRLGRRKSRHGKQDRKAGRRRSAMSDEQSEDTLEIEQIAEAWLPHVYLPPSAETVALLAKNARLIDASSKTRLDRRTLYSCLLLEWINQSASNRKFLDSTSAMALQAALSLATQPEWRWYDF